MCVQEHVCAYTLRTEYMHRQHPVEPTTEYLLCTPASACTLHPPRRTACYRGQAEPPQDGLAVPPPFLPHVAAAAAAAAAGPLGWLRGTDAAPAASTMAQRRPSGCIYVAGRIRALGVLEAARVPLHRAASPPAADMRAS